MDENQAFLTALRADPDDDTARLVYADWLDEHGEADQALYLRSVAELATLPPGDPHAGFLSALVDQCHTELDPGWVDAVGRRYNVVLRTLRDAGLSDHCRAAIVTVVASLLGLERKAARTVVASAPCALLEAAPYHHAVRARDRFRRLQTGRSSWSFGSHTTLIRIVITPRILRPAPRRFTSVKEAFDAAFTEATRLGMTMDAFVRIENAGNRVLTRSVRYIENHPSETDALPTPYHPTLLTGTRPAADESRPSSRGPVAGLG